MTKPKKIEGTEENWDSGVLGEDAKFAAPSSDKAAEEAMDDSLGLQMISIRFQKKLLEEIKMIADINGIGYQPLIKQVMRRFVDAEMKKLLKAQAAIARSEAQEPDGEPPMTACG